MKQLKHNEEQTIRGNLNDFTAGAIGKQQQKQRASSPIKIYQTGITAFDDKLEGGYEPGMHIIGGGTGTGKTALALQLATNMAHAGNNVFYFSFEVSKEMVYNRLVASIHKYLVDTPPMCIDSKQIDLSATAYRRRAIYDKIEHKLVPFTDAQNALANQREEAVARYVGNKLYILDNSIVKGGGVMRTDSLYYTLANLLADAKDNGVPFGDTRPVIVVDYLQYLGSDSASDKQAVDMAMQAIKELTDKYQLCTLVITSLNRSAYNKPATESGAKESGTIEYTADTYLVLTFANIGLLTDSDIDEVKASDTRDMDIKMVKNRTGTAGWRINTKFYANIGYFDTERARCIDGKSEEEIAHEQEVSSKYKSKSKDKGGYVPRGRDINFTPHSK